MGNQHTAFVKAGVKVAFVGGNQRIKLRHGPLPTGISAHKLQCLEPLLQGFKAQGCRNAGECGRQGAGRHTKLACLNQELDVVKAGVVVGGVFFKGLGQAFKRALYVASLQLFQGFLGLHFGFKRVFAGQVFV